MGHHLSKFSARANSQEKRNPTASSSPREAAALVETISLDEEELQVEEILTEATVSAATSPAEVRQIIIKIQLAKMENGNPVAAGQVESFAEVVEQEEEQQRQCADGATDDDAAALSADSLNANGQIVNVTLEGGYGEVGVVTNRTAGSSPEAPKTERQPVNNNGLAGSVGAAISTLQLHDNHGGNANCPLEADDDDDLDESLLRRRRSNSNSRSNIHHHHHHQQQQQQQHEAEVVEYCEVLESLPVSNMLSAGTQHSSKPGGQKSECESERTLFSIWKVHSEKSAGRS